MFPESRQRKQEKQMVFDSYVFTAAGGRTENQDAAGQKEKNGRAIYVVADGLGGHMLGNLASEKVVREMLSRWEENGIESREAMWDAIKGANEAVLQLQKEMRCSAKSTVAALAITDDTAFWANTGDSRVYYVSGRQLAEITEDHSVAYKKYKAGEITREQIAQDEDQACLLRALGNETRWEPGISGTERMSEVTAFLLCSDGFWEYISDDEILTTCLMTESAAEWGEKMLQMVNARFRPGHDNYTMITVKTRSAASF